GLQQPELRANARRLRDVMRREDGVEGAVGAFYRNLPLKHMRCDLGCKRIAVHWSQKDLMKLCEQCAFVVASRPENSWEDIVEYDPVDYTARGPDSALEGIASGAGAFMHELGSGVKDIFIKPTQGYRDEGAMGAVIGLAKGIGGIFIRPVQGAALFADHIATGHYNETRSSDERKKGTVLLDNKKFLNALGQKTAPDTHTAAMSPHEQLERDRRASAAERQQIAIHLSPTDRQAMEAAFRDIMQARSTHALTDDDFVIVRRKNNTSGSGGESVAPAVKHLVVSSTEYTAKGEIDIRFRGQSDASKSIGQAELEQLVQAARAEDNIQQGLLATLASKPIPSMNICMLTTGSWDESVQQFVAIGLRLQADGHRVRVATNSGFRDRIVAAGLEFFPLGGRATTTGKFLQYLYEKSQTQKKSKGVFSSWARSLRTRDAFPEVEDLKELMCSLWPACVDVDPLAPGRLFRADALIAHPLLFGQTAVAERLGVPLHCMSHSPLSRTQAFPHLMSAALKVSKPYRYTPTNGVSYDVISNAMWDGMRELLDDFRASLGLTGKSVGANLLADWRVPQSYLWDPELLPKPMDWGSEINVAGYVQLDEPSGSGERVTALSATVDEFVARRPSSPLLYFGFVRADWEPRHVKDMLQHIEAAAAATGVRVLFQTVEENDSAQVFATEAVLEVSSVLPAKDLLPRVHAAVHWGDLSITSRVLAAGKPACVVARNVAQRLWGQAIVNAGVGVEHLEVDMLTAENLAHVFRALLAPDVAERASRFAQTMASPQDAAASAVSAFYANLPLAAMTCDLDPMRIARVYDSAHQLKLSYEAHVVVRQLARSDGSEDIKYKPIKYSLHHPPRLSLRGLKDPVAEARGLAGGSGASGKDAPRLPRYTYDMVEDEDASKRRTKVAKIKVGATDKRRGKLNRYQSMAMNIVETPAFCKKINAAYEQLLLSRA
ncbi:hypothetical protein PybrP1_008939, partial [[Pythium] brassicae (nom. inval.)]